MRELKYSGFKFYGGAVKFNNNKWELCRDSGKFGDE